MKNVDSRAVGGNLQLTRIRFFQLEARTSHDENLATNFNFSIMTSFSGHRCKCSAQAAPRALLYSRYRHRFLGSHFVNPKIRDPPPQRCASELRTPWCQRAMEPWLSPLSVFRSMASSHRNGQCESRVRCTRSKSFPIDTNSSQPTNHVLQIQTYIEL